ncbi:MAG: triose-phosphate isomerase [Nitrospira sp. SB0662_bin_26]|nr:triose-phosphate isomerase [Nitrospira sp. SB0662_bin_26]
MNPRLIAGNWKMHKTTAEAVEFVHRFRQALEQDVRADILLMPPFTALNGVRQILRAGDPFKLGAQDLAWEEEGAYTGEVSGRMLKDVGCQSVIVGHSERRRLLGETDAQVNKKLKAALQHDLAPILCVGETLEERQAGHTRDVVKAQMLRAFVDVSVERMTGLAIAYEPVWAIGTGYAATVPQIEEVHAFLRSILKSERPQIADTTRILYGGSVALENAPELFGSGEVNGALVGKACLDPEGFAKICRIAS